MRCADRLAGAVAVTELPQLKMLEQLSNGEEGKGNIQVRPFCHGDWYRQIRHNCTLISVYLLDFCPPHLTLIQILKLRTNVVKINNFELIRFGRGIGRNLIMMLTQIHEIYVYLFMYALHTRWSKPQLHKSNCAIIWIPNPNPIQNKPTGNGNNSK